MKTKENMVAAGEHGDVQDFIVERSVRGSRMPSFFNLPPYMRDMDLRIIVVPDRNSFKKPVSNSYGILSFGKKGIHNNFTDEQLLEIVHDARKTYKESVQ